MWGRKKTNQAEREHKPAKPDWWVYWETARNYYIIGTKVYYLDRVMIVSKHIQYRPGYYSGPAFGWLRTILPEIVCDYADDNGIIREYSFGIQQLKNVMLDVPLSK